MVNQSAVNIPSSDYTNYIFSASYGDSLTVSGTIASATVCLNPSITNTCVVMPIGVNTSGNAFSSYSEAQGDFGLRPDFTTQVSGTNPIGFIISGDSYPTYLAQEYGINSFTISFLPLSNTFYAYVSSTTPIGEISFGTNAPFTYLPYNEAFGFSVTFPSYTPVPSYQQDEQQALFDTGANFNFLTTDVFYAEIPNFSPSSYESNCLLLDVKQFTGSTLSGGGLLNYGLNIVYQISYNSNIPYYSTTFTTEPLSWFCSSNGSSNVQWNVMTGNTIDIGNQSFFEYFGLPEMLRHTFVWVLDNNGYTQGIYISP